MNFALHLKFDHLPATADQWARYFNSLSETRPAGMTAGPPRSFSRIYIGDEFCSKLLPTASEINTIQHLAREYGLSLTLLTPILTDRELDGMQPVFDHINRFGPEMEVVINDWGVLSWLKKTRPGLNLSAGRLLNKGFKDPRLARAGEDISLSAELLELMDTGTFDRQPIKEMLDSWGIKRVERDLFPYGGFPRTEGRSTSIYYPYGYVTTGRVCPGASWQNKPPDKFIPGQPCSGYCRTTCLELETGEYFSRLLFHGNTVFYEYPPQLLQALSEASGRQDIRQVYQGFYIGALETVSKS